MQGQKVLALLPATLPTKAVAPADGAKKKESETDVSVFLSKTEL